MYLIVKANDDKINIFSDPITGDPIRFITATDAAKFMQQFCNGQGNIFTEEELGIDLSNVVKH